MQKYTDYGTDLLQPKSRVLQILAHFTRLWSFTKQNTRITQKQTGGTNLFSKWFTKLLDKERLNSSSITLKGATSLHSHAFHQDTDVGMYFSILLVFSGLRVHGNFIPSTSSVLKQGLQKNWHTDDMAYEYKTQPPSSA